MKRVLSMISFLLLAASLTGCGFQLRGAETANRPEYLQSIYVSGDAQYGNLIRELKSTLNNQGIQVTQSGGEADLSIVVTHQQYDRDVLTITRTDRIDEYRLTSQVRFKVMSKNGLEVLPEKNLFVERVQLYDRYRIIGKEYENDMLYKEMRQDIINQMLTRVYAISPEDIANAKQPIPPKEKQKSLTTPNLF